ncbi:hypothetical protein DIZ27_25275 [Streptomyces sp. NWU339]|nr:hypothetical protein DIZ27_25275 [Streptomyces sp. NWU339]
MQGAAGRPRGHPFHPPRRPVPRAALSSCPAAGAGRRRSAPPRYPVFRAGGQALLHHLGTGHRQHRPGRGGLTRHTGQAATRPGTPPRPLTPRQRDDVSRPHTLTTTEPRSSRSREASFAEVEQVSTERAAGRIAAEMIRPCPPDAVDR